MPKRVIFGAVLLAFALVSLAEECWLEPGKFRYAIGDEIKIDFLTGENFIGDFWDARENKGKALQWFSVSFVRDLSQELKGKNVTLKALQEGTQMVVMETNTGSREWEAGKFKSYLEDNGLDDVADARRNSNVLEEPATEEYKRYAKLLVQAGEKN